MAKVSHITIPGFAKMSKQRIFNKAVAHIATTRVKSFEGGRCVYAGNGCNAAPLLLPEFRKQADTAGSWDNLIETGMVPANNGQFIYELQRAHDNTNETTNFMFHWKRNMKELAERWNLSTSTLDNV